MNFIILSGAFKGRAHRGVLKKNRVFKFFLIDGYIALEYCVKVYIKIYNSLVGISILTPLILTFSYPSSFPKVSPVLRLLIRKNEFEFEVGGGCEKRCNVCNNYSTDKNPRHENCSIGADSW